jgi:hypothetical protein
MPPDRRSAVRSQDEYTSMELQHKIMEWRGD